MSTLFPYTTLFRSKSLPEEPISREVCARIFRSSQVRAGRPRDSFCTSESDSARIPRGFSGGQSTARPLHGMISREESGRLGDHVWVTGKQEVIPGGVQSFPLLHSYPRQQARRAGRTQAEIGS